VFQKGYKEVSVELFVDLNQVSINIRDIINLLEQ